MVALIAVENYCSYRQTLAISKVQIFIEFFCTLLPLSGAFTAKPSVSEADVLVVNDLVVDNSQVLMKEQRNNVRAWLSK